MTHKAFHAIQLVILITAITLISFRESLAQKLNIQEKDGDYSVSIESDQGEKLTMPSDGLWSIATNWKDDWPADWHHARPQAVQKSGDWTILSGTIKLQEGDWHFQDAYRQEGGRIKCIRRFEWHGEQALEKVTLSIRWKVNSNNVQAFLPGILYYGNPSGERNGMHKVPVFHWNPGVAAIFEEHRYPMPFACLEWKNNEKYQGAALHTLPSPVTKGNVIDCLQ